MKKLISVFLCVLLTVFCLSVGAGAVSINAGRDALNAQFSDGELEGDLDYVYYEPKNAEGSNDKYPLFIWLHGMKSGTTPRAQLDWYGFGNWSSEEYQARFSAGGCYLLAPRASTSAINSWDASMCSSLKRTIDYFINQHEDNIDTTRIYIAGYSTGGTMVWDMLSAYSEFFAAGLPLASIYQPTTATLNKLMDVSVWIFSSDTDSYVLGRSSAAIGTFNYLASTSARPDSLRMTTFSQAVLADGSKKTETVAGITTVASDAEHYVWEAVTHDMFMADGVTPYLYATTKDYNGTSIPLNVPGYGVINWLNFQTTPEDASYDELTFFERVVAYIHYIFSVIATFFNSLTD